MKPYYPIFLEVKEKNVLIVGGGSVALRKIGALLRCGAKVFVVSPKVHKKIADFALKKRIVLSRKKFDLEHLKEKNLVFCATNHESLNRSVAQACLKKKIWVNVADDPKWCSFIVPATIYRGEVTFAISTAGASPALSKFLRQKIEGSFGKELGILSLLLKKYRGKLLKMSLKKRRDILKTFLSDSVLEDLKRGQLESVEKKFAIV